MTYQVAVRFSEAEALAVLGAIDEAASTRNHDLGGLIPELQSVYEKLDEITPVCEWCGERMNEEQGRVEDRRIAGGSISAHADCFKTWTARVEEVFS